MKHFEEGGRSTKECLWFTKAKKFEQVRELELPFLSISSASGAALWGWALTSKGRPRGMVMWAPVHQAQNILIPGASGRGELFQTFMDSFLGNAATPRGGGEDKTFPV